MATRARRTGEPDVPVDPHVARSRETGGQADPDAPDQSTTTGTTPNSGIVGRVSGEDVGYEGETGAERRAEVERSVDEVGR